MPNRPIHILRYGTVAERVHLEKAISAYDYLAINGNSAAYVSTAISKFIVEKFFSKPEKGFFIDPITYAFQNEIRLLKSKSKATGEEKIKKSIDKLIDEYGYPVTKVRQNIPVSTEDFSDIEVVTAFCKKVLGFQYDLVDKYIKGEELEKYFMYMTPDLSKQNLQLRPKFLIAPYFYLDAQDKKFDDWLDINIKMARLSCKLAAKSFSNADVFVQIAINKNVLYNPNQMYALTQAYKGVDCSGYTIWIDDFNEHEASLFELKRFTEMLKFLSPKPVYNMYGGFFSILLTHKEISLLKGVSHGLEYGESRKAYPVGGGIPVSKYYYLPLHQRLDFTKAFYLLVHGGIIDTSKENWGDSKKYYKEICSCQQCKNVISKEMINFIEFESREFYNVQRKNQTLRRKKASSDTKQNCLYHYLLCKKMEFVRVERHALRDLTQELISQEKHYSSCEALKTDELAYLRNWAIVLSEVQGE